MCSGKLLTRLDSSVANQALASSWYPKELLQRRSPRVCPASSILSGQRQLDFPILFERYQQQSGLWEKWESRGFCGISKGGGKRGKPAFGFPRFPRPGFFHSPSAAALLLLKT